MKARGEVVDGCLVGEPTSSKVVGDEIKIGRRGYLNAEVIVHGKQGHSAYAHLADNPVPKLARIIDRVSSTPMDAGTARFQPSSVQATIVSVPNTATNVIPGAALANFNIRYNDLHTRAGVEAWVRAQCESAAKEVGAQFSLRFFGIGDVFLTEPGPLVETMRECSAGRHRTRGGADHQRRHVRCAVHLQALPGDRAGPRQRDGASGGRVRAGRRPADADADLPALHPGLFCRGVSRFNSAHTNWCALQHKRARACHS